MSRVHPDNRIFLQLVKKFPSTYGTRQFLITFYKRPPRLPILSQIESYASPSQFLNINFNIFFQFTLRYSKLSLSLRFPHQNPALPLLPNVCATCSAHLILLDLITRKFGEQYRSQSSSRCSLLHSPVPSSLSGPRIFVITLFSNILNLRSTLQFRHQVSHP